MEQVAWTAGAEAVGVRNVIIMGCAFFFLFSAYNTLQNYATSLFPGNLGNNSLAVLYLSVCVVVPFAPWIVKRFGDRLSMIIGGALYVVYMLSLLHIIVPVVLATSFVIGAGAAILWVAQGSYLTLNSSESSRGRNAGIFWGLMQTSNVAGNAAAFFVFSEISEGALYAMFCVLGAVGVLLMFFMGAPPTVTVHTGEPHERVASTEREHTGLLESTNGTASAYYGSNTQGMDGTDLLLGVVHDTPEDDMLLVDSPGALMWRMLLLFKDTNVLLLLPSFFLTGYELAFWTGEFPKTLDTSVIGLVLMFNGIGEILGGLIMGYLSDKFLGRSLTMLFGTVIYSCGMFALTVLHDQSGPQHTDSPSPGPRLHGTSYVAFLAAAAFGLGDSCFNTQVYAILGSLFPSNSVAAFTVFQLLQNGGSAVGFYSSPHIPLHGEDGTFLQIWLQVAVLCVSLLGFCLADRSQKREASAGLK